MTHRILSASSWSKAHDFSVPACIAFWRAPSGIWRLSWLGQVEWRWNRNDLEGRSPRKFYDKAPVITGDYLWMDKYYTFEAFISDEMAEAFKKEGITGLELRLSAITGATGQSSGGYLQRLGKRLRMLRSRRYDELDRLR